MPKRFEKRQVSSLLSIRETMFGDVPLSEWCRSSVTAEPWLSFAAAHHCLAEGDTVQARAKLQAIVETPNLESRHYLQAWKALRELGVSPPAAIAKKLLGVVVEAALEDGLDLLSAYADCSARYYNCSGAAVIWEHPDHSLDSSIDAVLALGQKICDQIGPWEGDRPPAPINGRVRLNMLTPSGLHFGEASIETLANDRLGGPLLHAVTILIQRLIEKTGIGRDT